MEENKIPDCLTFHDSQLQLKHICREAIRKHLLDLDPHQHLFGRIPKLGLPFALINYLLYGQSLDDDMLDDVDVKLKLRHRRRQRHRIASREKIPDKKRY